MLRNSAPYSPLTLRSILPPRGTFTPDGKSYTCSALSASDASGLGGRVAAYFTGAACECLMAWSADDQAYEMCYGYGACVAASFSMGRCMDDILDQEADPLYFPLSQVVGAAEQPGSFVFALRPNGTALGGGDLRSVIAYQLESWFVDPAQEFTVSTLVDSFYACGADQRMPVNLTYFCTDAVTQPERAVANISVYDPVGGNYSETCDPAATYGPWLCAVRAYCASAPPPCIFAQSWMPLNNSEQLDIGLLQDVWFPCANAQRLNPAILPSIAGTLDCNQAVHRVIDKAVFLATAAPLQCNGTVGPYTNVLGELYGLVYNQIPDVSFVTDEWGAAHYALVASIVNYQRWFVSGDEVERLDKVVMEQYIQTWITAVLESTATQPVAGAYGLNTTEGTWNAQGHLNPYTDLAYLLTNSTADLLIPNRVGAALCLPIKESVRIVSVVAPFAVWRAQLVSESGICATVLNASEPNATVNLPCVSDPGTYAQMLNFTITHDYARVQEAIQQWNRTCEFVLYYEAAGALDASMVFYSGLATQYGTLWDDLTRQITVDHVFPANAPLAAAYAAVAGAVAQPLNLSSPDDQAYLKRVWYTTLAPRKCSTDWQCKEFNRHGVPQCVFDALGYTPWLNGDSATGVTGREGGCSCPPSFELGYRDPLQFCGKCLEGYGPGSLAEWRLAVEYQRSLELRYPDLLWPVFNETTFDPESRFALCRMPTYTTTRPTAVCGGRGTVATSSYSVPETVYAWPNANGHLLTPSCTQILVNGTLMRNTHDSLAAQGFSGGGMRATVVADTLFLRAGVVYEPLILSCDGALLFSCFFGASTLQCVNDAAERLSAYGPLWTRLFN